MRAQCYNGTVPDVGRREENGMEDRRSAKEVFEETVRGCVRRDGVEDLLEWLEDSDFYTAPASTRYHGAHEGGLVEHSLAVYQELLGLVDHYGLEDEIGADSVAVCALFHDLCKVGCYKTEMRWRKDAQNQWEQYATYKFDEDFPFGGHGSKSVYIVQHFIRLEAEEAAAINCHMGAYDSTTYSNPSSAFSRYPLAWLLHVADEAATFLREE